MAPNKKFKADGELSGINTPSDAPSIYADAVQGMWVSPHVIKLSFVEHFIQDEEVKAKFVMNLLTPIPQLRAIGELLIRAADEAEEQLKDV